MTEKEKPTDLEELDLESAGVLESQEEKKEAMAEATEDEIIQVVYRSMEAVQEMMYQCNAAVTAMSARVQTLESFVAYLVENDTELSKKIKPLLDAQKAQEKYGDAAADPGLAGQMLREGVGTVDESALNALKKAGMVPQEAELLNDEKDDNESGESK